MNPIPAVLMKTLSAAPRCTTFVSPVTISTPTSTAARFMLPAIRGVQEEKSAASGEKRAAQALLDDLLPEVPQNEQTPFHPRSPYAVAKLYSFWTEGS